MMRAPLTNPLMMDHPNVYLLLITHLCQTPQQPTTQKHDTNLTQGKKIALLLPVTFLPMQRT
jgi:hypothetical protein